MRGKEGSDGAKHAEISAVMAVASSVAALRSKQTSKKESRKVGQSTSYCAVARESEVLENMDNLVNVSLKKICIH